MKKKINIKCMKIKIGWISFLSPQIFRLLNYCSFLIVLLNYPGYYFYHFSIDYCINISLFLPINNYFSVILVWISTSDIILQIIILSCFQKFFYWFHCFNIIWVFWVFYFSFYKKNLLMKTTFSEKKNKIIYGAKYKFQIYKFIFILA